MTINGVIKCGLIYLRKVDSLYRLACNKEACMNRLKTNKVFSWMGLELDYSF
jgi:hypothetical protein